MLAPEGVCQDDDVPLIVGFLLGEAATDRQADAEGCEKFR
jgi:hypothetical protein